MSGWPVQGWGDMGRRHTAEAREQKKTARREKLSTFPLFWLICFLSSCRWYAPHPQCDTSADIPSRLWSCSGCPSTLRNWRAHSSWRRSCRSSAGLTRSRVLCLEPLYRPLPEREMGEAGGLHQEAKRPSGVRGGLTGFVKERRVHAGAFRLLQTPPIPLLCQGFKDMRTQMRRSPHNLSSPSKQFETFPKEQRSLSPFINIDSSPNHISIEQLHAHTPTYTQTPTHAHQF